jgi:hypothetical protein
MRRDRKLPLLRDVSSLFTESSRRLATILLRRKKTREFPIYKFQFSKKIDFFLNSYSTKLWRLRRSCSI